MAALDDYKARVRTALSQMIDEGASDAEIASFKEKAKARLASIPGGTPPQPLMASPGPFRSGYVTPQATRQQVRQLKSDENERRLAEAGGPQVTYEDPYMREQARQEASDRLLGAIGSSFTDRFALGAPGRLLDMLPDKAAHYLGGTRAEREAARQASPVGDVIGATAGGGLSAYAGPEALFGKGVSTFIPAAKTVGGRIAASTVAGAGTGAISEGTRALVQGGDLRDAGEASLLGGAFGGALGGSLATAGEAGGWLSRLLRRNPTIGRYVDAKEAGVYQGPEMQSLPRGPEGIQAAREIGQERVAAREAELDQQYGAAYQRRLGELRRPPPPGYEWVDPTEYADPMRSTIDEIAGQSRNADLFAAAQRINAPNPRQATQMPIRRPAPPPEGLSRPIDRQRVSSDLRAARSSRLSPDTGRPYVGAEATAGKLDELAKVFEREGRQVMNPQADYGYSYESPVDTVGGALGQRRALQRSAAFRSASPTPDQLAAQEAYQALRGSIRNAAPDVAAADDAYSDYARQAERRRDILYRTEDNVVRGGGHHPEVPDMEYADELGQAPPQMRVGKEQAAAQTLGRIGDTNEPGLRAARYLGELAQMDPEFARALDFIANKKALEATRLSLHGLKPTSLTGAVSHGGLLPFFEQNARALGAKAVDPLASALARNLSPGALQRAPGALPPAIQLIQAAQEARRREAEIAARLRGEVTP